MLDTEKMWEAYNEKLFKRMMESFVADMEGREAMKRGEPVLMGGLTNGFIVANGQMRFLTFDPQRQFRELDEIRSELRGILDEMGVKTP